MNRLSKGKILKHFLVCALLVLLCEWVSWNLSYVSLIEHAPQWFKEYMLTFQVVQPWYEGNYFTTGFYVWMYFDARFICFFIMIGLMLISNLTLKYKVRQNCWKNYKWLILIPTIAMLVEFAFMLVFHTFGFISISIVGWYIILNTIFMPVSMLKRGTMPISRNAGLV